ncbi:MAG: peptide chain release factor N(5)-glutamine methyltransferase [Actinomycetota bacterium]|nr:peptide chain release factor N(5)-glutamine methyltransferase [Actinomycetota bacterium]MDH5225066.1 peptide chain release factor N(5)-glutamine methyltransferase [Actinomycetota bacterium]
MEAKRALSRAVKRLKTSPAIDHWQKGRERIEAEDLLMHVLGYEPEPDDELSGKQRRRFEALVDRRMSGEPIPYIKGYADFRGIEILTRPGVFVPRDSSEFLAEQAIRRLRRRKHPVCVDLATGGGTIALAVADEVPTAVVWGTDIAGDAVKLARKNAKALGLRAKFGIGDMFEPLPKRLRASVDVVTVHPPYVPAGEIDDLPDEVRDWEPAHTLTDRSTDGLGLIGRTVAESPWWLRPNGWLLMEVSPDRVKEVKRVYSAGGFRDVQSTKGGELKVTRVVVGRRPR